MASFISNLLGAIIPGYTLDENGVVESEYDAKEAEQASLKAERVYIDEEEKLLALQGEVLKLKQIAALAVEKADKQENELKTLEEEVGAQVLRAQKEREEADEAEKEFREREAEAKAAEEEHIAAENEVKVELDKLDLKAEELQTEMKRLEDIVKDSSIMGSFRWGKSAVHLNALKSKGDEEIRENRINYEAALRKLEKKTRAAKEKTAIAERARKPFLKELQEAEEAEEKLRNMQNDVISKREQFQVSRKGADDAKAAKNEEYTKVEKQRIKATAARETYSAKRIAATKARETAQKLRKQVEANIKSKASKKETKEVPGLLKA